MLAKSFEMEAADKAEQASPGIELVVLEVVGVQRAIKLFSQNKGKLRKSKLDSDQLRGRAYLPAFSSLVPLSDVEPSVG